VDVAALFAQHICAAYSILPGHYCTVTTDDILELGAKGGTSEHYPCTALY
jgi:hypothetical protein